MTLSFTSQPLRQGKSLYVPVPSSTPLVLLPLLLDRPLPLGSERNQIPSVCVHPADVDHYYRFAYIRRAIQQYKSIRKTPFIQLQSFFSFLTQRPLLKYYRGKPINFQRCALNISGAEIETNFFFILLIFTFYLDKKRKCKSVLPGFCLMNSYTNSTFKYSCMYVRFIQITFGLCILDTECIASMALFLSAQEINNGMSHFYLSYEYSLKMPSNFYLRKLTVGSATSDCLTVLHNARTICALRL